MQQLHSEANPAGDPSTYFNSLADLFNSYYTNKCRRKQVKDGGDESSPTILPRIPCRRGINTSPKPVATNDACHLPRMMSTFNMLEGNCRRCAFSSSYVPMNDTARLFRRATDLNDALSNNLRDMASSLTVNSNDDRCDINSVNSCITQGKSPSFGQRRSAGAVQSTEAELRLIYDRFADKTNEDNHNLHTLSANHTLSDFVIGSHYERESYIHSPHAPRGNTNDSAAAISYFHPANIVRARSLFRIRTKSMSSSGIYSNISFFIYASFIYIRLYFILQICSITFEYYFLFPLKVTSVIFAFYILNLINLLK